MQNQITKKSSNFPVLLIQIIIACGFGLLLGVVSSLLSGLLVFELLGAACFLYATLKRPEIALVGILIATATVVFEDQLPMLSAGGISLHLSDFLLVGMLGLVILRWLVEPGFRIVKTPLDWPLLIFFAVTLFWTLNAIFNSTVDLEPARRGLRVLSYYLTFFIVTNMVRERRQLDFLLNSIFLLATIVSAVMVAQFFLGSSVTILPGRVEDLNTQGNAYSDITRILPPGISLVIVAFVTSFCILVLEKFKSTDWLKFLQLGLFGLAFLFTFLRSYWLALIIVFSLLGFLLKGNDRQKLVNWIVAMCLAVVIVQLASGARDSEAAGVLAASTERLGTVFSLDTFQGQDGSLNYRKIENGYAFSQILSHPLKGLGIGAVYRPWDSKLDYRTSTVTGDGRNFIHNGHLMIFLQSGLFGYLGLLWLSLTFLIRGFKHWRAITDGRMKGVMLGFTLVYLAVVLAALVNSAFMQWFWAPVFGIIMGVNEVILMKFGQDELSVI